MTAICTHPNLISLGTTRCNAFTHCPDCGRESEPTGHVWVPADLDPDSPRVCTHCNAE